MAKNRFNGWNIVPDQRDLLGRIFNIPEMPEGAVMDYTRDYTMSTEEKVWKLCPTATYFGVDAKRGNPNAVCEVYESDAFDAKVIGEGDTYEEAWKDALKNLTAKK
jgi:hypothetical protein